MSENKPVAIFTLIEDIALAVWLALVRAGRQILGLGILFVGLVIEHILSYNVTKRRPLGQIAGAPILGILGFSVIETGIGGSGCCWR